MQAAQNALSALNKVTGGNREGEWLKCIQTCYLAVLQTEKVPFTLLCEEQVRGDNEAVRVTTEDIKRYKFDKTAHSATEEDLDFSRWTTNVDRGGGDNEGMERGGPGDPAASIAADEGAAFISRLFRIICVYQISRLRGKTGVLSLLNRSRSNDPKILFFEELKAFLLELSSLTALSNRLKIVDCRMRYLKAILDQGNWGSERFVDAIGELDSSLKDQARFLTKQLTYRDVHNDLKALVRSSKALLLYTSVWLYFVCRESVDKSDKTSTLLREGVRGICPDPESVHGKCMTVLLDSPFLKDLMPSPLAKLSSDYAKFYEAEDLNPFITPEGKTVLPEHIETPVTDGSLFGLRTIRLFNTGILRRFQTDPDLMEKFIKLHGLLFEAARLATCVRQASLICVPGGDLLTSYKGSTQLLNLISAYSTTIKAIRQHIHYIHSHANEYYCGLGPKSRVDRDWQTNFHHALAIHERVISELDKTSKCVGPTLHSLKQNRVSATDQKPDNEVTVGTLLFTERMFNLSGVIGDYLGPEYPLSIDQIKPITVPHSLLAPLSYNTTLSSLLTRFSHASAIIIEEDDDDFDDGADCKPGHRRAVSSMDADAKKGHVRQLTVGEQSLLAAEQSKMLNMSAQVNGALILSRRYAEEGDEHAANDQIEKAISKYVLAIELNPNNPTLSEAIAKVAKQRYSGTSLNLVNADVTDDDIADNIAPLLMHSNFESLDLSENRLSSRSFSTLAGAIACTSSLVELNLSETFMLDDYLEPLTEMLAQHPYLLRIDLSSNKFTANGASHLAAALASNTVLAYLNISHNSIGDQGILRILTALESNNETALNTLDLTATEIGDEGGLGILSVLGAAPPLTARRRKPPAPSRANANAATNDDSKGNDADSPDNNAANAVVEQKRLGVESLEDVILSRKPKKMNAQLRLRIAKALKTKRAHMAKRFSMSSGKRGSTKVNQGKKTSKKSRKAKSILLIDPDSIADEMSAIKSCYSDALGRPWSRKPIDSFYDVQSVGKQAATEMAQQHTSQIHWLSRLDAATGWEPMVTGSQILVGHVLESQRNRLTSMVAYSKQKGAGLFMDSPTTAFFHELLTWLIDEVASYTVDEKCCEQMESRLVYLTNMSSMLKVEKDLFCLDPYLKGDLELLIGASEAMMRCLERAVMSKNLSASVQVLQQNARNMIYNAVMFLAFSVREDAIPAETVAEGIDALRLLNTPVSNGACTIPLTMDQINLMESLPDTKVAAVTAAATAALAEKGVSDYQLTGFLKKKSPTNFLQPWQKRLFILENGTVSYYKGDKERASGKKSGEIPLTDVKDVKAIGPEKFNVSMKSNERIFELQADSESDCKRWVQTLKQAQDALAGIATPIPATAPSQDKDAKESKEKRRRVKYMPKATYQDLVRAMADTKLGAWLQMLLNTQVFGYVFPVLPSSACPLPRDDHKDKKGKDKCKSASQKIRQDKHSGLNRRRGLLVTNVMKQNKASSDQESAETEKKRFNPTHLLPHPLTSAQVLEFDPSATDNPFVNDLECGRDFFTLPQVSDDTVTAIPAGSDSKAPNSSKSGLVPQLEENRALLNDLAKVHGYLHDLCASLLYLNHFRDLIALERYTKIAVSQVTEAATVHVEEQDIDEKVSHQDDPDNPSRKSTSSRKRTATSSLQADRARGKSNLSRQFSTERSRLPSSRASIWIGPGGSNKKKFLDDNDDNEDNQDERSEQPLLEQTDWLLAQGAAALLVLKDVTTLVPQLGLAIHNAIDSINSQCEEYYQDVMMFEETSMDRKQASSWLSNFATSKWNARRLNAQSSSLGPVLDKIIDTARDLIDLSHEAANEENVQITLAVPSPGTRPSDPARFLIRIQKWSEKVNQRLSHILQVDLDYVNKKSELKEDKGEVKVPVKAVDVRELTYLEKKRLVSLRKEKGIVTNDDIESKDFIVGPEDYKLIAKYYTERGQEYLTNENAPSAIKSFASAIELDPLNVIHRLAIASAAKIRMLHQKLSRPNQQLGDKDAEELSTEIAQKQFVVIMLQDNQIGSQGLSYLTSAIHDCPSLRKLNLKNNTFGDPGAADLSGVLESHQSLKWLSLQSVGITAFGATQLCSALESNKTLEYLDLSFNDIGDIGVSAVATLLREHRKVAIGELLLSSTNMGNSGAKNLLTMLPFNSELVTLITSDNPKVDGKIQTEIATHVKMRRRWKAALSKEDLELLPAIRNLIVRMKIKDYTHKTQTALLNHEQSLRGSSMAIRKSLIGALPGMRSASPRAPRGTMMVPRGTIFGGGRRGTLLAGAGSSSNANIDEEDEEFNAKRAKKEAEDALYFSASPLLRAYVHLRYFPYMCRKIMARLDADDRAIRKSYDSLRDMVELTLERCKTLKEQMASGESKSRGDISDDDISDDNDVDEDEFEQDEGGDSFGALGGGGVGRARPNPIQKDPRFNDDMEIQLDGWFRVLKQTAYQVKARAMENLQDCLLLASNDLKVLTRTLQCISHEESIMEPAFDDEKGAGNVENDDILAEDADVRVWDDMRMARLKSGIPALRPSLSISGGKKTLKEDCFSSLDRAVADRFDEIVTGIKDDPYEELDLPPPPSADDNNVGDAVDGAEFSLDDFIGADAAAKLREEEKPPSRTCSEIINDMRELIEDLWIVKDDLEPVFPKEYDIMRFFMLRYHQTLMVMISTEFDPENITYADVLQCIQWLEWYGEQRIELNEDEPLPDLKIELDHHTNKFLNSFVEVSREKIQGWVSHVNQTEIDAKPEQDNDGLYFTHAPLDLFSNLNKFSDTSFEVFTGNDLALFHIYQLFTHILMDFASQQRQWLAEKLVQEYPSHEAAQVFHRPVVTAKTNSRAPPKPKKPPAPKKKLGFFDKIKHAFDSDNEDEPAASTNNDQKNNNRNTSRSFPGRVFRSDDYIYARLNNCERYMEYMHSLTDNFVERFEDEKFKDKVEKMVQQVQDAFDELIQECLIIMGRRILTAAPCPLLFSDGWLSGAQSIADDVINVVDTCFQNFDASVSDEEAFAKLVQKTLESLVIIYVHRMFGRPPLAPDEFKPMSERIQSDADAFQEYYNTFEELLDVKTISHLCDALRIPAEIVAISNEDNISFRFDSLTERFQDEQKLHPYAVLHGLLGLRGNMEESTRQTLLLEYEDALPSRLVQTKDQALAMAQAMQTAWKNDNTTGGDKDKEDCVIC